MKKKITMALLSVLATAMFGCNKNKMDEGPWVTENRILPYFTGIDLQLNADVYFRQGNTVSIAIEAPAAVTDRVITNVVQQQLLLLYKDGKPYTGDNSIRIIITAPDVGRFTLNTPGSIFFENTIEATTLLLHNNGSGDIVLKNVVAGSLNIKATASGSITAAEGTAVEADIDMRGSGNIHLDGVATGTIKAKHSGAGLMQVTAIDQLNATIEGSGSIYFHGYPDISSSISGTGQLMHF